MKYYAAQSGNIPALFQDPGYTNINHIVLSTSTLTSPAVVIGGFGAVTKNGYGVGKYMEPGSGIKSQHSLGSQEPKLKSSPNDGLHLNRLVKKFPVWIMYEKVRRSSKDGCKS